MGEEEERLLTFVSELKTLRRKQADLRRDLDILHKRESLITDELVRAALFDRDRTDTASVDRNSNSEDDENGRHREENNNKLSAPEQNGRTDQRTYDDGEAARRTHERNPKRPYNIGTRIYISNRIRRPVFASNSWTAVRERQATITKIVGDRVYYVTDNGTKTWRLTQNVAPLNA